MKKFKIIIEKHPDGYVAYPIGLVGAVVGQGETKVELSGLFVLKLGFYAKSFLELTIEPEG